MMKLHAGRFFLFSPLLTGWIAVAVPQIGFSQSAAAQAQLEPPGTQKAEKPLEFAAVSIRQNKTGGPQLFGSATPDGYQMRNMFLAAPIVTAYVPQTGGASSYSDDQLAGFPSWLTSDSDHYDIDAKIDEADLAKWQDPALQPAMLRAMLQSMLADRLKLVVHRATKIGPVYLLEVGKNGPKFKATNPADAHSGAYPFPGGGMLSMEIQNGLMTIHYFGISMEQLATLWSGQEGRPVQDKTGLAGKYDIAIQKTVHNAAPSAGQPDASPPDSDSSIFSAAEELGLRLEPAKGEIETLVIDHVERPSQN
jgi:bla regulator protein blaR1